MMKKGQIFGHPFIYIFIIVVAVLILVFGVRLVINLTGLGQDIKERVFFEDIEKKFNTVLLDSYGSVITLEGVTVPSTVKEICFVDYGHDLNLNNIDSEDLKDDINFSYLTNNDDNVFIIGEGSIKEKIDTLVLNEFVLCDNLNDKQINIKLTNIGQEIKAEAI